MNYQLCFSSFISTIGYDYNEGKSTQAAMENNGHLLLNKNILVWEKLKNRYTDCSNEIT